jgi:iron complex transport system substrate-binding protein
MTFLAILVCILPALASIVQAEPVRIVDDPGNAVELQTPARRVISLYGAFAEMLYAIGAGPSLIARTQADEIPPEIRKLPAVGTHMRPNVEMLVGLKPDLVVQSASRRSATPEMDAVAASGIPVAIFSPKTLEGISSTMERLGVLTGREGGARAAVDDLRKRLEAIKTKVENVEKRPRVFFEVRAEPLAAAGKDSIVQEILTAAGAENVVSIDTGIARYGFELLLRDDPDFYIVQSGPMNKNPPDPRNRSHFDQLRAVREGRVLFVDELLFSRPGPRTVDAVAQLAELLFPDRFESASATPNPAGPAPESPGKDQKP